MAPGPVGTPCQGFLDLHRPDAVRILDFPHAVGYLAAIAHAQFGAGTVAAAAWLATQRHDLRHAPPETVIKRLRILDQQGAQPPAAPSALDDARHDPASIHDPSTTAADQAITAGLAYLESRIEQLRYAEFQAAGYPIGSGCAESANKLVVEARLKGSGMHWARAHVNAMVALRTVACTDRWEEVWPQIGQRLRDEPVRRARQRRTDRQAPIAHHHPLIATVLPVLPPPDDPLPASAPVPSADPTASSGRCRPARDHPWRKMTIGNGRPLPPRTAVSAES